MKINNIIVHHVGGTDAYPLADSSNYSIEQCDRDHRIRFKMKSSLGWWVGYHYFIDKKGKVTQTRKDTEEGAHCVGWNNNSKDPASRRSIGICLAGNFDATLPTEAQKQALTTLLKTKMNQYSIKLINIVPHRNHASKTCYGKKLAESWARNLIVATKPTFDIDLGVGMTHLDVIRLQQFLNKQGFPVALTGSGSTGFETTYFGIRTQTALAKFQKHHKITPAVGYCGKITRALINKLQ